FRFVNFRAFRWRQESCQSGKKIVAALRHPLTLENRADRVFSDEVSAAPGVRKHSQPQRTDQKRRPPRLTTGSCRGRGSSPARFTSRQAALRNAWEPATTGTAIVSEKDRRRC